MTEHEVMQTITKIDRSATRPAPTTLGPFSVFSLQGTSSPSGSPSSDMQIEAIEQAGNPPNQEMHHNSDESASQHQENGLGYRLWNGSIVPDTTFECLDSLSTSTVSLSQATDSSAHRTDKPSNYFEEDPMRPSIETLSPDPSDETFLYSKFLDDGAGSVIRTLGLVPSSSRDIATASERNDTAPQSADMSNGPSYWHNRCLSDTEPVLRNSAPMGSDWGPSMSIVGNTTPSDMLIHHYAYAKHMVHLMQPVSHHANPFRTIYLPLAIEGSPKVEIVCPSDRVYSASVTVFHSLMAIAAIHLQSLQSREDNLR